VGSRDTDATTILPLQSNLRQRLIQSDAESFKFPLDDAFVSHGLLTVHHDQNERASSGNTNDLLSTTFTILGTLDDTWQVKQLDFRASIIVDTWNTGQRCELIVSRL